MNVGLKIWGMWDENLHGAMDKRMDTIWERIDRAIATIDWIEKFPDTKIMHLECGTSDHKPIVIFPSGIPKKLQGP